jgi:hypothetical protein
MIGGGNVEVDADNVPTNAVHTLDEVFRSSKIIRSSPL